MLAKSVFYTKISLSLANVKILFQLYLQGCLVRAVIFKERDITSRILVQQSYTLMYRTNDSVIKESLLVFADESIRSISITVS